MALRASSVPSWGYSRMLVAGFQSNSIEFLEGI